MGLTIISETVSEMCKVAHSFSDGEKEFVVQFAFKSGDKTLTNQLIDELSQCEDGQESQSIMEQYAKMIDMKPMWVSQIENLLVSIEMYRIEEEKAINRLAEVLTAYGVDVTEEQVRRADAEEIKEKVNEISDYSKQVLASDDLKEVKELVDRIDSISNAIIDEL